MRKIYSSFRSIFLLTVLMIAFENKSFGQIAAWQLNGKTGDEVNLIATTLNSNLNTSTLSRGNGINASALANAFGATNFTATGTKTDAINNGKYFLFSINPKVNYQVSLSTLDVRFRRSSTGPNTFRWQYSLDGTTFTDIGTSDISYTATTTGGDAQTQINLSSISALQNVPNSTTITFRLLAWGASATSGTFAIGRSLSNGATDYSLAIGGTVVSGTVPSLLITPSPLSGFTYVQGGGPSSSQSFTLSGSNINSGDISVNGSTNYEVSNDNATWGNFTIPNAGGSLANTTVYVRLKAGLPVGNYNGEIIAISGGGATASVTVNGLVSGVPTLNINPNLLSGFTTTQGTASPAQTFSLTGSYLSGTVTVTAPTDYEVSTNGTTYNSAVTVTPSAGTVSSTIYVRIKSSASSGNPSGNVTVQSTGAVSQNVAVSGTVNPGASITANPTALSGFTTMQGVNSLNQTFSLTGSNLTSDITVTAPAGFEVSLDGNSFNSNLTVPQVGGTVSSTVYVRLSSTTNAGTYNGSVSLTSGSTSQQVTVSGKVKGIVISQIYGGGGNAGATYSSDFIELFNPTSSSISLTGYSIQYTSASGTTWGSNRVILSGTIAPKKYFLIELASGANGAAIPTPDLVEGSINMSATAGKIVLVYSTTSLTGSSCPTSNIIDKIGYGAADCSEGGNAPTASNTTGLFRLDGGCTDTDNNSADFSAATPNPRNSASAANTCSQDIILPVHFTNIKAKQISNGIQVDFTNATETDVVKYEVERSLTGTNYTNIATLSARRNDGSSVAYTSVDHSPVSGINYYRIKSTEVGGKVTYSNVAKVNTAVSVSDFSLYPNPVKGSEVSLQLNNLKAGVYSIKVYNGLGQLMQETKYHHAGGSAVENVSLQTVKPGLYSVTVSSETIQLQKALIVQ